MDIARRLIADEREKKTGFLDLGNLGLTELPVELLTLIHLCGLNLGHGYVDGQGEYHESSNGNEDSANRLPALPSSFGTLRNLVTLSLRGNPLIDLGPLRALTALQQLNCWNTAVTDLSPLHALTALQTLKCSYTPITDLSPLRALTALQTLECSGTQVTDLSPLHALTALQTLKCSSTQITDPSPLIGTMSLQKLTVNYCRLDDFPRQLLFQQSLRDLTLHQTTIPGIPAEVLSDSDYSSCLKDLREHLVDAESGLEKVLEAKLLVLGNGRVGKTQICRRLRGLPYDETVTSTHGITVTAEPWVGSMTGEVLNIWDFGGQDIYHGAHTLFMKTSAVFLIVWHPDFETTGEQSADGIWFRNYPLPYWLEYARTLGRNDCPVLVVQARCDRPEQEVHRLPADDTSLQFTFLKPCWYSAKTQRGHGALEEALRDAIQYLRERDGIATIGVGRARVLRQLEAWRNEDQALPTAERRHRTLSQAEFHTLCEQIGGVRSPEHLLTYLHNLGVVFYQPHLFDNRIILDQSWALEAVYTLFDRRKAYPLIQSLRGRFTQSLLAMTAWRDYSEPEQRLFLSLMESCGIVFVHRKADPKIGFATEYLAPDLLPDKGAVADQLAGRWNDTDEGWRLEYSYPFLHPGLMRTLLCDVGRRSQEAGVYWKFGVWLYEKSTGCRALLEQQMDNERQGRIILNVRGHRHQELVRWLCERIEQCNRLFGYPKLKPAVGDFGPSLHARQRAATGRGAAPKVGGLSDRLSVDLGAMEPAGGLVALEPTFDKPPESFFPSREPQVFISYAWGDDTPAGRQRAKVVDDLCTALGRQGITVRRDRDEMRPGDLISEFMDRLAEGDFVIVIISDKYLRSEYCMYELFRIYRNCAHKPDRFRKKVIPIILPDSNIDSTDNRLERAIYWTNEEAKLKLRVKNNLEAVGPKPYTKFWSMGEFAHHTSDMLEELVDQLQPRDFERQAQEGFKSVLEQIARRR
ncbi:MAG: COR domain-containing protein [Nitrospira sp.]|nr:COR domain-containing protein [Nitrospira sp.]